MNTKPQRLKVIDNLVLQFLDFTHIGANDIQVVCIRNQHWAVRKRRGRPAIDQHARAVDLRRNHSLVLVYPLCYKHGP